MTNGLRVVVLDIEDAKILLSLIPNDKDSLKEMLKSNSYSTYSNFKDNVEFVQDFVENRMWK